MLLEKNRAQLVTQEELIYISRQFANMFGIPVRLYCRDEILYSQLPFGDLADPIILCSDEIDKKTSEIDYYIYNDCLFYGIVNCLEFKFVAGPVSEIKLSKSEINRICFALGLNTNDAYSFTAEMNSLAGVHLDTILQEMIIFNFSVNGTMRDISEIRIKQSEQHDLTSHIKENQIDSYFHSDSGSSYLKSYLIDSEIVKKIAVGDVDGLIDGATKVPAISSGELAPHLLRHNKNFFIKLETMSARAAIDAGLDFEEILSLEEMYIRKCESLDNIDRIKNLQYHMILDYADRVKKQRQYNSHNSKTVNEIAKYIRNHISEPIKISEIADHFGKSRGGITTEFKKQTGMNLSDFIKLKKIQEAQELICDTDKSLVAISNYLGFSSQSHFIKIFKEIAGITPKEYRERFKNY